MKKLYRNFFLSGNAFEKHFYKTYANKLTQVQIYQKTCIIPSLSQNISLIARKDRKLLTFYFY